MASPIPTTMNRLLDERIYIGSLFSIREPNSLQEAGITHILTLIETSFTPPPTYTTATYREYVGPASHSSLESQLLPITEVSSPPDSIDTLLLPTHFIIPLQDHSTSPLLPYLPDATAYIQQALSSNDNTGTVLIHCNMGRSRSCAVAAGYLISVSEPESRITVQDALLRVQRSRPSMSLSPGFVEQLELWRAMGCPSTRAELERRDEFKSWKLKVERIKMRKLKGDKPPEERSRKEWGEEGKKVEKAIERLDGRLGESLKRNTEIAQKEKMAHIQECQQKEIQEGKKSDGSVKVT